MVHIKRLLDNEEKSNITNKILRELPEWFSIEDAIIQYINEVKKYNFYGLYHIETPIGFISVKHNDVYT